MKLPTKTRKLKDLILEVLGEEFPLSTKEIFQRVRQEHGRDATYQAVHKSVLEAIEEEAVVRIGKSYQLNSDWIQRIKKYSHTLEQTYSGKKDIAEQIKGMGKNPIHIRFNDISELCTTVVRIGAERMLLKENIPYYTIIRHGWWPLRFSFADFTMLARLNGNYHGSMGIIASDTPFDRWVCKQYQLSEGGAGGYAIIDPTIGPIQEDVISLGKYVIRARFSKATGKFMDQLYQNIHGLQELLAFYHRNNLGTVQAEIDLTIEYNPVLSQFIAEKVKRHMHANKEYQQSIKEKKESPQVTKK